MYIEDSDHQQRKERGLLFDADCRHCGKCIDDHRDPERYGYTRQMMREKGCGYRHSLASCPGFAMRQADRKHVVWVCARRLFYGEAIPWEFWEVDGIKQAAEKLLAEKEKEWEKAESAAFHGGGSYGSVLLIGNHRGVPFVIDMGTL